MRRGSMMRSVTFFIQCILVEPFLMILWKIRT